MRQYGGITFGYLSKTVVRRVNHKITRTIICGNLCSKAAAHASSINNDVFFVILHRKSVVNKLHIVEHFFLTAFAGALSKSAVVNQNHIIIIAVKILCVFRPPLNASGIAMKVKNKTVWFFGVKMKSVNSNA